MLILACDTSTDYLVLAVGDDDGQLHKGTVSKHDRDLSQTFYFFLENLLQDAGIRFADIDVLAVGVGPGSFTGVRIAVTTMKTLAQVTGKKLVAVDTLNVLAQGAGLPHETTTAVVMPSRRGEVYCQLFAEGSHLGEPVALNFIALDTLLSQVVGELVIYGKTSGLPIEFSKYRQIEQPVLSANALLACAAQAVRNGIFYDPLSLNPKYVAPPAISQHKTR